MPPLKLEFAIPETDKTPPTDRSPDRLEFPLTNKLCFVKILPPTTKFEFIETSLLKLDSPRTESAEIDTFELNEELPATNNLLLNETSLPTDKCWFILASPTTNNLLLNETSLPTDKFWFIVVSYKTDNFPRKFVSF